MEYVFNEEVFNKLKETFESNEKATSSQNKLAALDSIAFNRILDAGEQAIPFVLKAYRLNPALYWSLALNMITGEDPIGDEGCKSLESTREEWFKWAEEKKYL